jgi:4-hydroxy-2-oxoheptanedioate aldolase
MHSPSNRFKAALAAGEPQFGLWAALASPYVTELLATACFDWLLIDNEHAPNDVPSTLAQLQALAAYASHPVVRPVRSDAALIKQLLDIGAQTLLLPMIDTAAQAAEAVAATRYPPHGIRGVGSALARASRWNGIANYLTTASDELCVLVQAETLTALDNLADIATVEGLDGVFFGPADLSASMGYLGQPSAEPVREAIRKGIATVRAAGKACGVLAPDLKVAAEYQAAGATFIAVGTDTGLLSHAARVLVTQVKGSRTGQAQGTRTEAGAY